MATPSTTAAMSLTREDENDSSLSASSTTSPYLSPGTWRRVCFLICDHCLYVEFPGCGAHQQIYSRVQYVSEGNEPRRLVLGCMACSDHTGNTAPFSSACRGCHVTKATAHPMLLSETQIDACERAIFHHQIATLVETAILHCSTCGAVEFPTIQAVEAIKKRRKEELQQPEKPTSTADATYSSDSTTHLSASTVSSNSSSSSVASSSTSSTTTTVSTSILNSIAGSSVLSSSLFSTVPPPTHGFLFNKFGEISDVKWLLGETEIETQIRKYEEQVREERADAARALEEQTRRAQLALIGNPEESLAAATIAESTSSLSTESSSASSSSSTTLPVVPAGTSSSSIDSSSTAPIATTTSSASASSSSIPAATPLVYTELESERLLNRLLHLAKQTYYALYVEKCSVHYFAHCHGKFEILPVALSFSECNYLRQHFHRTPPPPISHAYRLHEAVRRGDDRAVDALLQLDVARDSLNQLDHAGKTPLHIAAWYGRFSILTRLISAGADLQLPDKSGWTALEWCVYWRHSACIKMLIWSGATSGLKEGWLDRALERRSPKIRDRRIKPQTTSNTRASTAAPARVHTAQGIQTHEEDESKQAAISSSSTSIPITSTSTSSPVVSPPPLPASEEKDASSSSISSAISSSSTTLLATTLPTSSSSTGITTMEDSSSTTSISDENGALHSVPSVTAADMPHLWIQATIDTLNGAAAANANPSAVATDPIAAIGGGGAVEPAAAWPVPNPLAPGPGGPPAQVLEALAAAAKEPPYDKNSRAYAKIEPEVLILAEQAKLMFLMGLKSAAGKESPLHTSFATSAIFERNLVREIFDFVDPFTFHFCLSGSAANRHLNEVLGRDFDRGISSISSIPRAPPTSQIVSPSHPTFPFSSSTTSSSVSSSSPVHIPIQRRTRRPATQENETELTSLEEKTSDGTIIQQADWSDKNTPFNVAWTSENTSALLEPAAASSSSPTANPVVNILPTDSASSYTIDLSNPSVIISDTPVPVGFIEPDDDASTRSSSSLSMNSSTHSQTADESPLSNVTDPDITFLLSLIPLYTPRQLNLPTDLLPFVPQYYYPAELPRGCLDEMLKPAFPESITESSTSPSPTSIFGDRQAPTSNSSSTTNRMVDPGLGLKIVDEVDLKAQSNPEELLVKWKKELAKQEKKKQLGQLQRANSSSSPTASSYTSPHRLSSTSSRIVHVSPSSDSPHVAPSKSDLRGEIFSLLAPFKNDSPSKRTSASSAHSSQGDIRPENASSSALLKGDSTPASSSDLPALMQPSSVSFSSALAPSPAAPVADIVEGTVSSSAYLELLEELQRKTEALNRISALVEERPESAAALSLIDPNHHPSSSSLSPNRAQIRLLANESPIDETSLSSSSSDEDELYSSSRPTTSSNASARINFNSASNNSAEGKESEYDLSSGLKLVDNLSRGNSRSEPRFGRRAQSTSAASANGSSSTTKQQLPSNPNGSLTDRPRSRHHSHQEGATPSKDSTTPLTARRAIATSKVLNSPTSRWFH